MKKRRTADEVARLLRDVDHDLAKGLTVSDACRKIGIAETTYYRWRQRHDPAVVDADRRCRELESEVERLERLVAELMLDKQMLQDIAKKTRVAKVAGKPSGNVESGESPREDLIHAQATTTTTATGPCPDPYSRAARLPRMPAPDLCRLQ